MTVEKIKFYDGSDKSTPEQRIAIKRALDNMPPSDIFKRVADSIPKVIPDATSKPEWNHGGHRIVTRIAGYDLMAFDRGTVPKDADLSKIEYVAFYRQAVKNESMESLEVYVSTVPLDFCEHYVFGQSIEPQKWISIGWKEEEVEEMARESFLRLQELVIERYNRK